MGRYVITLFLAYLIVIPSLVSAVETDKPIEFPGLWGTFTPEPGAWSEYVKFDKVTGKRTVTRMSIVGVDRDSYWYEVVDREEKSSNIVKMLVKGDPNDPENIQRLIMKSGLNPAREMPRDFILMGRGRASPNDNLENVRTGEGVVTVPAGTFAVGLHQIVDMTGKIHGEYKFSRDVRPFGVITSEFGNLTMMLVSHGGGAKSLIKEEPAMTVQPPGVPGGMVPGMGPDPGTDIRQIPGMGTGYESRQ